ncbi:ABC transporter ferrichrome-binding protein [Leifsonia xyli subsp. cynodontis DSM 46306]|uniref:RDD domain-containing protein n=1 Tax=Leifsonia xyli subsp. cynodontis DSM 46306 TaxID=1389489 RepID=U3P7D3_LEIXC|nr:RDD family protein [Leifsonia xyli]AGW42220.1 ABC transporter ferrichrome-binding protein [Leifsonia xyli subsp. cynodontis DSM 46306]
MTAAVEGPPQGAAEPVTGRALVTGEAVTLDVRPAGYILRAAGTIIDAALSLLVMLARTGGWLDRAAVQALVVLILVFGMVVLPMGVELLTRGKSLGRLAVGARIMRDDGGAIGFRHAFVRALVGVLEIFLTVGGIAALTGLLNPRSQRLGDLLAGTHSQLERIPRPHPLLLPLAPQLTLWAQTADVGRLPDRLSWRIAQFLRQAPQLTPAARLGLSTELAREASVFVSPLPPVDAETFLVAVASLRRNREAAALSGESQRIAALAPVLSGLPHSFPDRRSGSDRVQRHVERGR